MSSDSTAPRQKVALVTGGSSGIGFAVSKELAEKGYKVYAAARRLEPMEPLKEFGVIPVQLDVADPEAVQDIKKFLKENLEGEKLDILYNNAGQSCTFPAMDVTDAQVEQAFKVNVFGSISLTRELLQFVINAQGTILFSGSIAGYIPFPFSGVYCATKAALHQYARVLHLEVKGFGVRVINVVTGGVRTNIADTRPLPKDSVFNTSEGREAFANRQALSKNSLPMAPEVYAKKIVKDIESSADPIDIFRGKWATIAPVLIAILPRWVVEYSLCAKFGLFKVFQAFARKNGDFKDLHLE